jgi:[NiFe] hydrogenase diaphorase moiety large subunit
VPADPSSSAAPQLLVLLARHHNNAQALVQILREWQALKGWLARADLSQIALALGVTLAQVEGVAGFYRFLHTQPVGTYRVLFSDSITDRLLGSEALRLDLCQRLRVAPGQLRDDGRVSVATTSCTGLCDQGPALLINHQQIVTRLDSRRVEQLAALIEQQVPLAQ